MTPSRLVIWAVGAVVAVLVLAALAWSFDPFNRRQRAEMKATNAVEQSRVTETVAKALDTHTTQTIILKERETRAVEAVQKAPGAADLLPPDLRTAWLDGVRNIAAGPADRERPQ